MQYKRINKVLEKVRENRKTAELYDPFKLEFSDSEDDNTAELVDEIMGSLTESDLLCDEDIKHLEMNEFLVARSIVTNVKGYYLHKARWLQFFHKELGKGYYTGYIAIARCHGCSHIIDSWPCKEMRLYEMPKANCGFCNEEHHIFSSFDFNYYAEMQPKKSWVYYTVKNY